MAEHADGSIIVDTEIDEKGFKAGSDRIQKAINSMNSKMKSLGPVLQKALSGSSSALSSFDTKADSLEDTISEIESKMKQLGNSKIATSEYDNLCKNIEKADQALFKMYDRRDKMEAIGTSKDSQAWKALEYDIKNAEKEVARYERTKASMESKGTAFQTGMNTAEYAQLNSALSSAKTRLAEMQLEAIKAKGGFAGLIATMRSAPSLSERMKISLSGISAIAARIGGSFRSMGHAIRNAVTHPVQTMSRGIGSVMSGLRYIGQRGVQAFSKIGRAIKGGISKLNAFRKSANSGGSAVGRLSGKFQNFIRMFKQMILFRVFMGILTAISDGFKNLSQYSSQANSDMSSLKSSLTQLKNSFATAFAPILTVVTPILSTFIGYLSEAITYLGKLFAALTGATSFTKATAVQEDYAASLDNTSSAAEDAKRQLAGFDELNVLSDSSSSSGGSASPSEMFEEVPIESKITDFANSLKDAFRKGDYAEIGKILGNAINDALQKINDFISWDNVGEKITSKIKAIAGIFNSLVDTVNWELMGDTIAQGLNTVLNTLYLIITEFDWPGAAAALARCLNGLVSGFDWKLLGKTISTGFITALKTLRSAISTFDWAALGKGVADAINEIDWVGAFSEASGLLSDAVKGLYDIIIGFVDNLDWSKLGRDVWNSIVGIVTNYDWGGIISRAFHLLGSAIGGAGALIGGFALAVWESIKAGFENIKETYFSKYMNEYGEKAIEGFFQGIGDMLSDVGIWIVENIWEPFKEGFCKAFGIHSPSKKMEEQGVFVIEGLLKGIENTWENITSWFDETLASLESTLSEAWTNIKEDTSEKWAETKDKLSTAWSEIKSDADTKWSELKTTISTGWGDIKSNTSEEWSTIKSELSTKWSDIKTTASTKWGELKTSISTSWSGIKTDTDTQWSGIKTNLSTAWSNMKTDVSTKLGEIENTVSTGWSGIKTKTAEDWSGIKTDLSTKWSEIKDNASTKWDEIKSTIENKGWPSLGTNICNGISSGIDSGWSWLKNKVSTVATSLLDEAKTALDIHSPSRLFRDIIGLNIGYGIGEGIEASKPSVLGTVKGVATAIAQEFNAGDYRATLSASGVNEPINDFADKIVDGFISLADKLQAIANRVTFAMPNVAINSIIPYSVSASASSAGNDVENVITASNEELGSVIIQSVTNATTAIVNAIEEYSGTTVNIDSNSLTTSIINEINQRTRMNGKSPLLI